MHRLRVERVRRLEEGDQIQWECRFANYKREMEALHRDMASDDPVMRPDGQWRGWSWDSYQSWADGEDGHEVDWSPLDQLDGLEFITARIRLSDAEQVSNQPNWSRYGCALGYFWRDGFYIECNT